VDELDARQIRRQRLSAGFPPLVTSNPDRRWLLVSMGMKSVPISGIEKCTTPKGVWG